MQVRPSRPGTLPILRTVLSKPTWNGCGSRVGELMWRLPLRKFAMEGGVMRMHCGIIFLVVEHAASGRCHAQDDLEMCRMPHRVLHSISAGSMVMMTIGTRWKGLRVLLQVLRQVAFEALYTRWTSPGADAVRYYWILDLQLCIAQSRPCQIGGADTSIIRWWETTQAYWIRQNTWEARMGRSEIQL